MMSPCDVVGSSPGSGEAEAPPRSRSSLSSEVEVESEPWGRTRRSSSSEAETGAEPWGRARRSFLWRPRLDLAAVSLVMEQAERHHYLFTGASQMGRWSYSP